MRMGWPLAAAKPTRHVARPAFPQFAVVASEKGVVVGRLTFREDGDQIDCRRMGVGGKAIPPNIDKARERGRGALHAALRCGGVFAGMLLACCLLAVGMPSTCPLPGTGR